MDDFTTQCSVYFFILRGVTKCDFLLEEKKTDLLFYKTLVVRKYHDMKTLINIKSSTCSSWLILNHQHVVVDYNSVKSGK